ncbi:uncharacterized protein LOC134281003 [Saccostrea cucullata]|uniref:uncharacterized protein LOC134281003 n=1 Tax=Saccostrea cuccullata TaxID=36930 RepID=UPI002ED3F63C
MKLLKMKISQSQVLYLKYAKFKFMVIVCLDTMVKHVSLVIRTVNTALVMEVMVDVSEDVLQDIMDLTVIGSVVKTVKTTSVIRLMAPVRASLDGIHHIAMVVYRDTLAQHVSLVARSVGRALVMVVMVDVSEDVVKDIMDPIVIE